MIKKAKVNRDLLVLSFLTLITILTWIGMDVYRRLAKSKIPEVLEKELLPLDSQIKTAVFDVLENRPKEVPPAEPDATQSGQVETSEQGL